ncbi:MAG: helix-turn-helix domain-containing protein [Pseudonocardiaceae bacterium]
MLRPQPETVAAQRRHLGSALATFRHAAELSQAKLGEYTHYDRTSINKIEHGQQLPDRSFWEAADRLLGADDALLASYDDLVQAQRRHADRQRQAGHTRHQIEADRLRSAGTLLANSGDMLQPPRC